LGCEFPNGEDGGTTGLAKHRAYIWCIISLLWVQEEPVHRALALTFNIYAICGAGVSYSYRNSINSCITAAEPMRMDRMLSLSE